MQIVARFGRTIINQGLILNLLWLDFDIRQVMRLFEVYCKLVEIRRYYDEQFK